MRLRLLLTITLLLGVVLFTLQNTELVAVRFFLWEFELSRALLIFLAFTVGIIIGLCAGGMQRRKEKTMAHQKPDEETHDRQATL